MDSSGGNTDKNGLPVEWGEDGGTKYAPFSAGQGTLTGRARGLAVWPLPGAAEF